MVRRSFGVRPLSVSIVIAAHNEEAVIGRCLDSIMGDAHQDEFEVTVVANGCVDETAAEARRRPGIRVLETPTPGKSNALNIGDAATSGFPRFYLDADIIVNATGLRRLATALIDQGRQPVSREPTILAVVPARRLSVTGRPVLVKAYFTINSRLPAYRNALFGRGLIGITAAGRARFDTFPEMIADDLFLDSLFSESERCEVSSVETIVETPWRTSDLVRRLARVRRGNAAMRAASTRGEVGATVRGADRLSFLRDIVLPDPRLIPAAAVYVALSLWAAVLANLRSSRNGWRTDNSTRRASTEKSAGLEPRTTRY